MDNEADTDLEALDTPVSGKDGQAAPEEDVNDQSAKAESEDQSDDSEQTEEGDSDSDKEEDDELDFGYKKYRVPKSLKAGVENLRAEFTRKAQETAETKKALEARESAINQQAKSQMEFVKEVGQLQMLDQQIARIQNLKPEDWKKLEEDDPLAPQRVLVQMDKLRAARDQLVNGIRQKEQERNLAKQREDAKRTEEFHQSIAREFKDWGPDLNTKLTNYARAQGYSDDELKGLRDIRHLKILREAAEGRELKEKLRKQTAAAKAKIKEEVTPLKGTVTGKAPARNGLSDDIPVEDWIKLRNKQEAARRDF